MAITVTVHAKPPGNTNIVYNLVNYPTLENGDTLTGTITTNGDTGLGIDCGIIQSWQLTISGPSHPFSLSSTDSGSYKLGLIDVTPTSINASPDYYLQLGDSNKNVLWDRSSDNFFAIAGIGHPRGAEARRWWQRFVSYQIVSEGTQSVATIFHKPTGFGR